MKAPKAKATGVKIKIGGKDYEMKLTMRSFHALEMKYGSMELGLKKMTEESSIDAMLTLVASSLYEGGKHAAVDEDFLLDNLGMNDISGLGDALASMMNDSMPQPEDMPPNA